jgi:hypothetical protein
MRSPVRENTLDVPHIKTEECRMSLRLVLVVLSLVCLSAVPIAMAQPAQWWVQGNGISGNPVGCGFYNNTAASLRITTYRFFTGLPQPYVFTCTANCIVHPGETRVILSPLPAGSTFSFTCDALVSNY